MGEFLQADGGADVINDEALFSEIITDNFTLEDELRLLGGVGVEGAEPLMPGMVEERTYVETYGTVGSKNEGDTTGGGGHLAV